MSQVKVKHLSSIRLKEAMKEKGYKQSYIAKKLGCTAQYVSNMTRNTPVSEAMAQKLAPILDKPVWWLLGEKESVIIDTQRKVRIHLDVLRLNGLSDIRYRIDCISDDKKNIIFETPEGFRSVRYEDMDIIIEAYDSMMRNIDATFSTMIKKAVDSAPFMKDGENAKTIEYREKLKHNDYESNDDDQEIPF